MNFRIWVLHCPFRKDHTPVLGIFGATTEPVVIMTLETWTRLVEAVPALKTTQFEVGTADADA
jgi:hypothetical protein